MSLNSTPLAQRTHIGFFGRTNTGKSSIVNAVTGQNIALVSNIEGTTTDPVFKSMELLPLGPVTIIDTAGFDDKSELGALRIEKTKEVLIKTDIAVLVVDATVGLTPIDEELVSIFKEKDIAYVVAYNKADLINKIPENTNNSIYVSALNGTNIFELKEKIASFSVKKDNEPVLVKDIVKANDKVIVQIKRNNKIKSFLH